jgi:hypothetical protein
MKAKISALIGLLILSAVSLNANAAWFNCTPENVMSYSNRVHVKCQNSTAGISYFAMSTSNVTLADRFVRIATAGLVSGRTVIIEYTPSDTSGTSFGCAAGDCRKALSVGLR